MAKIAVDGEGYARSADVARYRYRWQNPGAMDNILAAAAVEQTIVLDEILSELKILNARLGCPNFIAIPTYLRGIARDANRRNRRVDDQAKAKRRATRLAKGR